MTKTCTGRRHFLAGLVALGAGFQFSRLGYSAEPGAIKRSIPSSGQQLPAIGMGTWLTFAVGDNEAERAVRCKILQTFFDHGGALIDSSPMYASSQDVLGACLSRVRNRGALFAATKVWIPGRWLGIKQMEASRERWGVKRFDLMQIHNMLDWETHLETLKQMKAEGKIRYIGITTSHGRRHEELEQAMRKEAFDFVQFTYNVAEREVEQRLLPLAAERRMAVIINRPFDGGGLFERIKSRRLPAWAAEFDCHNWAQYFLKFIISHPAVTCAIPATSRVDHMVENMGALTGRLPDEALRKRMVEYFEGRVA